MAVQDSVVLWDNQRQIQSSVNTRFERHLQVNKQFAKQLTIEKELEGHDGCVNCLEWNNSGELLASGSDDFNVIIWNMIQQKALTTIASQHEGNIFSVKFLPYSNDTHVASASADSTVRIHHTSTGEQTHCYTCHIKRVKRLCTSKQSPYMFWSGSEDGTVREFDLRQPHTCTTRSVCSNILINLASSIGPTCEVKCIQIHPLYPEYIAVGCTDPYLRLYDRRMLTVSNNSNNNKVPSNAHPPPGCLKCFVPGHIKYRPRHKSKRKKEKLYVTTYASFSPNGRELIQNLGGEHIYIYNINKSNEELAMCDGYLSTSHKHNEQSCKNGSKIKNGIHKNGTRDETHSTYECRKNNTSTNNELSSIAQQFKLKGNDAFSKNNYFQAILWYNEALKHSPRSSMLYANKAAALLKRAWDGDIYDALKLCRKAVALDGSHVKAMYRQARCLYELKWYKEASKCIQKFKETFPEQSDGSSLRSLENELKKFIEENSYDGDKDDSEDSSSGDNTRRRRQNMSNIVTNDDERTRQENAIDYKDRLVGACNTNTDIKEVSYFGNNGQFIVAGSDCGCLLLWERATTNLIEAWQADDAIVNCVQPHPNSCMIATSGIDPVIRLWSPKYKNEEETKLRSKQVESLARSNQKRMNIDPLEEMLRSMGYRAALLTDSEDDQDPNDQCRTQ